MVNFIYPTRFKSFFNKKTNFFWQFFWMLPLKKDSEHICIKLNIMFCVMFKLSKESLVTNICRIMSLFNDQHSSQLSTLSRLFLTKQISILHFLDYSYQEDFYSSLSCFEYSLPSRFLFFTFLIIRTKKISTLHFLVLNIPYQVDFFSSLS